RVNAVRVEVEKTLVAYSVSGTTKRTSEGDPAFQPGDRHRRIGRTSAAGDDEVAGRHLGARDGETLDTHDDVLHGDACAKDLRLFWRAFSQSLSRLRPKRG